MLKGTVVVLIWEKASEPLRLPAIEQDNEPWIGRAV